MTQHVQGVSLISDGTSDGTRVLLDGRPITGITHVAWSMDRKRKRVKMVLEIDDVSVEMAHEPDQVARNTLERVV